MGMYTTLEENNLDIIQKDKLPEWFLDFLDYTEKKFWGYMDEDFCKQLNEWGINEYIHGEIIVRYEEGNIIKFYWDEKGCQYSIGKVVFENFEKV